MSVDFLEFPRQILNECDGSVKDAIEFLLPTDFLSMHEGIQEESDVLEPKSKKRSIVRERDKNKRGVRLDFDLGSSGSYVADGARVAKWKESEWEKGGGGKLLEGERVELMRVFVPCLGQAIVEEVLQTGKSLNDARKTLW